MGHGVVVAVLVSLSFGKPAEDTVVASSQRDWRIHGRESFLDFLLASGCHECEVLLDGRQADFRIATQYFGCADVDVLLPSLHRIYDVARRRLKGALPGLLVDGGANIGRATWRWIAAFGDTFGRRTARNATLAPCIICAGSVATKGSGADGAATAAPSVVVAAVEPSDTNFALLQMHAAKSSIEEGFLSIKAALGDKPGEATLAVSHDFAVDEVATLLFNEDDARGRQRVRVVTLDDVALAAAEAFPGLGILERGIFLLKLDIEGLEPFVLRSFREVSVKVKFVTFEYSAAIWQEPLAPVVADLSKLGFFCFIMTAERLYPVSGPFWDTLYELPVWSNLLCGLEADPDLEALVQLHVGAIGPWAILRDTYLPGFAADDRRVYSLPQAQRRCNDIGQLCAGVTCDDAEGSCTVREGFGGPRHSPQDEVSFLRDAAGADLFLLYRRLALAGK